MVAFERPETVERQALEEHDMTPVAEAVAVGLAVSILVAAIIAIVGYVVRLPSSWGLWAAVGISAIAAGVLAFLVWPPSPVVPVPDIGGKSGDEAVLVLTDADLRAAPEPLVSPRTPPGYVVPLSQNPSAGTSVQRGSMVRYGVSAGSSVTQPLTSSSGTDGAFVAIFSPMDGGELVVQRGADNVFRFDVEGTVEGFNASVSSLLLWVQPIDPPSDQPGWYLQRAPNGIRSVAGTQWRGVGQIGNAQWPSENGHMIEVAASSVSTEDAGRLLARQGPLTVLGIPGVVSRVVRVTVRVE
jgi:hypothetical protein